MALRVLFVHGLESGPTGSKVKTLRDQGLEVRAEDMHMSLRRLDKRNSVLRSLLRTPELWATVGLSVGVAAWGATGPSVLMGAPAIGAAWLRFRLPAWTRWAMASSLARCVAVQRAALLAHTPDVVVGSSWGGAVVVQLLLEGSWQGPTVLLAPAHHKIQEAIDPAGVASLSGAIGALRVPMIVLHDPDDEVVPYAGAEMLASVADVRPCPGAGHRLLPVLATGAIAAAVREVAAGP